MTARSFPQFATAGVARLLTRTVGPATRIALLANLLVVPASTLLVFAGRTNYSLALFLRIFFCTLGLANGIFLVVGLGFALCRRLGLLTGQWTDALLGLLTLPPLAFAGLLFAQAGIDALAPGALTVSFPRLLMIGIPFGLLYGLGLYSEERFRSRLGEAFSALQEARHRERELTREREAAELARLRALVEPHFLFNALTALAALAPREPGRTQQVALALARLLRAGLREDATELVPLADELALVADYLAIEQLRLGPRLTVEIAVPEELRRRRIPTLLLLPLVENAVTHGAARVEGQARVVVTAVEEAGALRLQVVNDSVGLGSGTRGRGLRLVEDRLRLHYGSAARLRLTHDPSRGETVADLELPLGAISGVGEGGEVS